MKVDVKLSVPVASVTVGSVAVVVSVGKRGKHACTITDTVGDKLVYGFASLPHDAVQIAADFALGAKIDSVSCAQAVSQVLYHLATADA